MRKQESRCIQDGITPNFPIVRSMHVALVVLPLYFLRHGVK